MTWAGFYVGGDLGFGSGQSTYSFADPGNSGFFACGPCGGPWDSQSPSASNGSVIGGLHVGYNWQVTPMWLAGLEGDFAWTGIHAASDTLLTQPGGTFPSSNVHFQTDVKWLASLRGRLGLTRDNWLAYFTGGVAWSDLKFNASASCPASDCAVSGLFAAPFSASAIRTGFVLGGGGEWQVPNSDWRARFEYLYYRFNGSESGTGLWQRGVPGVFDCGPGGSNGPCSAAYGFGTTSIQTVRFGLSYAFH
jgi:outer membrane immunogenic protein